MITNPECKIEKVFWLDNNTKSPCFKISDIPETKQITITIMGTEKGKSRSFGTYRFAVRNTAPKVIVLIIIRCGIRDLISPGLSNCRT